MKPRLLILFLLALIIGATWAKAQEGNYRFENFGNQSVLLNGNVTGSVADLGLTFYNPARLALIENPRFAISGKAYQWNKFTFNNTLEDRSLRTSEFEGVPSIVAGTFELGFLPGHKFAYSFISRYRTDVGVNYSSGIVLDEPIGVLPDVAQRITNINLRNNLKDEWFGLSWGHQLGENIGIGASAFLSVFRGGSAGELFVSAERENGDIVTYARNVQYQQKTYGLFLNMGVAWKVSDVDLGANIRLPFIPVVLDASGKYEEFQSNLSPEDDLFISQDYPELNSRRRTAAGVFIGAGIPWGKHKIHLNADWHSKVGRYERIVVSELPEGGSIEDSPFNEELRSVINFGAGAEIFVSPVVKLIGSFSSDFSSTVVSANLFDVVNDSDRNINLLEDFWHFGLGTEVNIKWGKIVLGTTYSRTSNNLGTQAAPPVDPDDPIEIVTDIGFERWRFIVGLEFPLLEKKLEEFKK